MVVSSKELLLDAKKNHYGIAAPDFIDLDSARTFVQVAEEQNKPIILSFAQSHQNIISLEEAAAIGKLMAESVNVPIVLHLDHGEDIDFIKRAIELGFSSVMIDASMECFEENVRKTKEVVELAHAKGITVEAEIGHVGQGESFGQGEGTDNTDSIYTTVEEAVSFVEKTGIDSLAVSIGTAHGLYKGNKNPVLNFERLHELSEAIKIPLVLHGSSGTGDDNLHRCATEGISKVNVFTDFLVGAMKEIDAVKPSDFVALKKASNEGMAKVLRHYFKVFSND
jgi:fructose-bisphosphate aldolase class II/tagatose 1,6-diphosphate aldolase GatY/KbaY